MVTKVSDPLEVNMEEVNLYDLILLDIMMPGTDGFELCSKIREFVDCPVLFLTAKTEENSLVNGLSLGADNYPIIPEKVTVEALLGDIKKQASGLAEVYRLKINWKEQRSGKTVNVVYEQVVRAVMNIIQNAAEQRWKSVFI